MIEGSEGNLPEEIAAAHVAQDNDESLANDNTSARRPGVGVMAQGAHESGYPKAFVHALQTIISKAEHERGYVGLLLISIDNLSMIMQGYGHETSERAMEALVEKIKTLLNDSDIISRLQKDQIAIILSGKKQKTCPCVSGYDSSQY